MSEKKNSAILKAESVMNDKDLLGVENANERQRNRAKNIAQRKALKQEREKERLLRDQCKEI